jgi:hypothetical protein
VHRSQAVQEIRRKREKLAMDNVRLGKVVSTRGVSGLACILLAQLSAF